MYDVIIVGAGIGGLICGCYLAKAGVKVLIAEQHHKPGGYCTAFRRKGYSFDAAAHSFGGYRENGLVRRVFRDLGIEKRLVIVRYDPTDLIITPHGTVAFHADMSQTIASFEKAYPAERPNIVRFFHDMVQPAPGFYAGTRTRTFKQLLDGYFADEKLKAVLAYPLYGNVGLPPSTLSALIGARVFSEFLIDGGYYPQLGMQALSDALADRFVEMGGSLRLSCRVKTITQKNSRITGAIVADDEFVQADSVISNADARQTFDVLLDSSTTPEEFKQKLMRMEPSSSMFILYVGCSSDWSLMAAPGVNTWVLPHYNLDALYDEARKGQQRAIIMLRVLPDQKSFIAFAPASYQDRTYWTANKSKLLDHYLAQIDDSLLPGLSRHLEYKDAATPITLFRYTANFEGAAYGWAATPEQLADHDFRKPAFVQGLYLTGHWTTQGTGIPGVAYVAYDTAKLVIKHVIKHCKST